MSITQLDAKEGDTVTPGTKIATVTKGAAAASKPAASEPPKEEPKAEQKEEPKAEQAAPEPQKAQPPPPPPPPEPTTQPPPKLDSKPAPSKGTKEGQLLPKDLERRVSDGGCVF